MNLAWSKYTFNSVCSGTIPNPKELEKLIWLWANKNNIKTKDDTGDTDTEPIVMLTLEERTKLSKLLSVFTLFIWILTSIIATKF